MLRENGVLTDEEINRLIPNVVDHLLQFHSRFLTLLQYKKEEIQVFGVQEILTQQVGTSNLDYVGNSTTHPNCPT